MYNNFAGPRNGFPPNYASTSRMPHAWPPPAPPPPAYYGFPHVATQHLGAPNFPASGGTPEFSNQTVAAPCASSEVSDRELMAIVSKYQTVKPASDKPPKLNVSTISQLLSDYKRVIQSVDSIVKYLEVTKKTISEDDWAAKSQELDRKKEVLLEMEKQLSDPDFTALVRKTVNRVKAKRKRIKRKKAAWKERKKELKEIREEKHKKIDLWLEKMKDEVERAQRAEMVRKEADLVLSEVTHKKTEAKRVLGLLNSLTKLRNAKLQQLASNEKVSLEETKSFDLVIEKLKSMWAKQLKEYNMEEQGLKVMLNNAEVERVNTEAKSWRQNLNLWTETLFGEKNFFDPLQAQPEDFSQFLSVRKDWDCFVAAEDTVLSSSIPVGWVLPVKPSNGDWERCLKKAPIYN